MKMPILEFNEVTKIYNAGKKNEVTALDRFSLKVVKGEMIVLLGPSGCGKTTLLRMVSGLETITSGGIFMNGNAIGHVPPAKRPVAMVFQNYALYPHMTAQKNLVYALEVRKVPKPEIKRRLRECCRMLRLDEALLARKPGELSGGQRQRVALGRAVMQQPKVFLLDEPFSSLDQNLKMHLRVRIREIQKTLDLTVLMVTHDQGDAMAMGDRVVLMNQGKIVQTAAPKVLYHAPQTLFAATFMGWPQVNRVPGQIYATDGGGLFCRTGEGWDLPMDGPGLRPGQKIILCIRPEQVRIHKAAGREPTGYMCVDEEMSGITRFVRAVRQDQRITGIPAQSDISPGDPVRFSFHGAPAPVFDAGTGLKLAAGCALPGPPSAGTDG